MDEGKLNRLFIRGLENSPPFSNGLRRAPLNKAVAYAKQKRKQNFVLKLIFVLWLAVIPAVWTIIEYLGPDWLARLVLIYVLVKTTIAGLRVTGHIKLSAKARKDAEEKRLKNHHHYHCTINPSGFSRLKAENFDDEIRSITLNDSNRLKS